MFPPVSDDDFDSIFLKVMSYLTKVVEAWVHAIDADLLEVLFAH